MSQGSGTDASTAPATLPTDALVARPDAVRTAAMNTALPRFGPIARVRSAAELLEAAQRMAAAPRNQARAAFACTALLVVGIAWLLADALWFVATGSAGDTANSPTRRPAPAMPRPAADMNRVAEQHLFGVVEATPARAADGPAPVTSLPLQLLGVFVSGRPSESTAVIAEESRDGQLFKIGESVPGNAVLSEVHNDRVVLQRGPERETLAFPEHGGGGFARADEPVDGLGGGGSDYEGGEPGVIEVEPSDPQPVEAPDSAPVQANGGGGQGGSLARYRDRLRTEPSNVLSEIGMQPISGGAAQGYRVGENVGEGLARVGLQPGDVVLTVNGRPVGNIQNDQQQVDSVMSQGSARLEIQRGNRRFFVTASLR